MNIDKNKIYEECLSCKNGSILIEKNFKKHFPDAYADLCNWVFPENFTFIQKAYHYFNDDIDLKLGMCKTCGNRCKFKRFTSGYYTYCSNSCAQLDAETKNKIEKTCKEKYGVTHYSQSKQWRESLNTTWLNKDISDIKEKRAKTKAERYGDANYNNKEKISETLRNRSDCEKQKSVEKTKKTKYERYGNANYVNAEKIKRSWEQKSVSDIMQINDKTAKTKIEKYGDAGYHNVEKAKKTCLEKYGVSNPLSSNEIKERMLKNLKNKYGVDNVSQLDTHYDKFIKTRRHTELSKKDFLIDYTDDGLWVCKCSNGFCKKCNERTYITTAAKYNERITNGNEPCTKLNPIGVTYSGIEYEIYEYIKSIYNGDVLLDNRAMLKGKEIDIYIPELNIGFEINGDFWHMNPTIYKPLDFNKVIGLTAEDIWKKDKQKIELAKTYGVKLYTIWETEWKTDLAIRQKIKNIIYG